MSGLVATESQVLDSCLKWLWNNGCFVWRNNTGAWKPETGGYVRYGLKGSGDILGVNPKGRFIAVECKRKGNTQTAEQMEFEARVKSHRGVYILAYSIDDLEANKEGLLS